MDGDRRSSGRRWRLAAWTLAAGLLLLPAVAMGFTDEVRWGAADFALFALMLLAVLGGLELALRASGEGAYRAAMAVALLAAFLLLWADLAVGLVGSEGDPVNLLFALVPAIGVAGAALARLRPRGMARALAATALAQLLLAPALLLLVPAAADQARDVALATGLFGALWLLSAWLFRRAARARQVEAGIA